MNSNVTEFAAWIIVANGLWLLTSRWFRQRTARVENLAVNIEYKDVNTSLERRQLLLARYPHYIVVPPNREFNARAKYLSWPDQPTWKQWLQIVAFCILFLGMISLLKVLLTAGYAYVLGYSR